MVREWFYWLGSRADVENLSRICDDCLVCEDPNTSLNEVDLHIRKQHW